MSKWFDITRILFTVMDLKKGTLYAGDPESGTKVDTTLTIEDQDMVDMVC